ncbi:MAG: helix-turn-helix domain-containing protein [Acidimicrobiales bacterium]
MSTPGERAGRPKEHRACRDGAERVSAGGRGERPLSVSEAAAYLNVNVRYVRRLVAERRVTYLKVGRLLRFRASDLEAYLESCRVEPPTSGRRSAQER